MELTKSIVETKVNLLTTANVDVVKVLNTFNGRGLENIFYEKYLVGCTELESNILYELLNKDIGENKSLHGSYNIYDHCIINRGYLTFVNLLTESILESSYIALEFMLLKPTLCPKIVKGVYGSQVIRVSYSPKDSAKMVLTYITILKNIGNKLYVTEKEPKAKKNKIDTYVKLKLISVLEAYEKELRQGKPFKLWITANNVGNDDGLFLDYRTFSADNLAKFITNMLSDNIVAFLSFITYTSTDLTKVTKRNHLKQVKIIYSV